MKIKALFFFLAAAVAVSGTQFGVSRSANAASGDELFKSETQVRANLDAWFAAVKAGKWTILKGMMTKDFMQVSPNGRMGDRSSFLKFMKKARFYKMDVADLNVWAFPSVIVSNYELTSSAKKPAAGVPASRTLRVSDIWIKKDGSWKLAVKHTTKVIAKK